MGLIISKASATETADYDENGYMDKESYTHTGLGVQVTGGFDVPINSKVNFSGQTQLYILGTYAYYGAIQFVGLLVFKI